MIEKKSILVIGSSNTDLVVKVPRFPAPGETLLGGEFFMNNGGKGANQAIAVSRLGGNLEFVCKTGNDSFREQTLALFESEGIDTRWMHMDEENPSGVAIIMVDENGENSIVVASGANSRLSIPDIDNISEVLDRSDYMLLQLEIPIPTVEHIINLSSEKKKNIILNPAPAANLRDEILEKVYILTPNEIEAGILSGIEIKGQADTNRECNGHPGNGNGCGYKNISGIKYNAAQEGRSDVSCVSL